MVVGVGLSGSLEALHWVPGGEDIGLTGAWRACEQGGHTKPDAHAIPV